MTGRTLQPKVVSSQDGATYRVGGQLVTIIARAADTNGVYSLFETHTAPGEGVRLYRQQYEDETFWVLEGTYTFVLNSQQQTVAAGSYIYVPRRTIHAFTNSGAATARMLVLATPGGIRERFLADVGERTTDGNPTARPGAMPNIARLLDIAQKYGIEILPLETSTGHRR